MLFINRLVLALIVLLFINACGQLPTKEQRKESADGTEELTEGVESAQQSEDSIFVAIAKPESKKSVSVPSQARDEFSKAKQAMLRKNWKEAEEILLLMTSTYPELAGIYTNLGIVYEQMNESEKAENAYRFALQTNPLNFDAYTNLGVLLREQGKFDEAEQNYLAALKKWPHHQASILNLGILYDMYLGRLNEALGYYQLAQKLNAQEDRQLKGWIIDLQRRLPKETAASVGAAQ